MSFNSGFGVNQEAVRRQFRVSVFMVAGMAIFAFTIGFAMPTHSPRQATTVENSAGFVGRLVTADDR